MPPANDSFCDGVLDAYEPAVPEPLCAKTRFVTAGVPTGVEPPRSSFPLRKYTS